MYLLLSGVSLLQWWDLSNCLLVVYLQISTDLILFFVCGVSQYNCCFKENPNNYVFFFFFFIYIYIYIYIHDSLLMYKNLVNWHEHMQTTLCITELFKKRKQWHCL
ncbi:hypothetical protein SRHO_G00220310 [Serrasalmus rhombeus]